MSDTTQVAPKIETPTSADEIPGGLFDLEGVSPEDAAAGLFDALGSDDDELFEEPTESEQSTPRDGESEEDEDEDPEFDESGDDLDDEDEEDSEESDEDESDDGENDEDQEETLYDVPGSDGEKVTLEEALAGYSRTADYTRKRQRDAAEHATAMSETREIRTKYAEGLERLQETLTQLGPQVPDAALRKSNPGEFAAQMAEYQAYQDTLNKVGDARESISSEESAEIQAAKQDYVAQEWGKILAAVPEWQDQEVATAELAEIRKFAIETGFTAEEVDGLADSRLFLLLKENRDLKAKRTGGKKKIEQKKKASKRLAPGAARTPRARTKSHRKQQRAADQLAAQTGSVRDAARAIEMLLDD